MSARWYCPRWIGKRRCGARMHLQLDGSYECHRCNPPTPLNA